MTLKHYEATVHLRIREGRGKRSPTPTSLSVSVTLVLSVFLKLLHFAVNGRLISQRSVFLMVPS